MSPTSRRIIPVQILAELSKPAHTPRYERRCTAAEDYQHHIGPNTTRLNGELHFKLLHAAPRASEVLSSRILIKIPRPELFLEGDADFRPKGINARGGPDMPQAEKIAVGVAQQIVPTPAGLPVIFRAERIEINIGYSANVGERTLDLPLKNHVATHDETRIGASSYSGEYRNRDYVPDPLEGGRHTCSPRDGALLVNTLHHQEKSA